MSDPLENHLAQFILELSDQALKQSEDSIFMPCIPSISFSQVDFTDEEKLNEKLKINQIPLANPICWPQEFQGNIKDKIQEFYQTCEFEGAHDALNNSEKQTQVSFEIKQFDQNIDELHQKILSLKTKSDKIDKEKDDPDLLNQEINKLKSQYDKLKIKKLEYIDSNLHFSVMHYKQIFVNYDQKNILINFNFSALDQDQIYLKNPQNLVFSEFKYNSQDKKLKIYPEDSQYSKLSQILKGLGIGQQQSQFQLQKSIEEVFEKLIIECEFSKIHFQRNWIPFDLLENSNIGLKNKQISQWSNGKNFDQDSSAEFPYVVVGAIVCRNILIKGFKTEKNIRRSLLRLQCDPDQSFALTFQLQDPQNDRPEIQSCSISEDFIKINSLRVLGLILQPLKQFPKIIYQSKKENLQIIEDQTEDIKNYIEMSLPDEVIISCFMNNLNVTKIPQWENLIQNKINQIKEPMIEKSPGMMEELPKIKSYDLKLKLKNNLYPQFKVDLNKKMPDPACIYLYGVNFKDLEQYISYFNLYKCITNREENIFLEEKQISDQLFQSKYKLQEISEKTLIHSEILKKMYNIQDEIENKSIDQCIINQKQKIIEYLELKLNANQIIEKFKDENNQQIISIFNWQEKLEKFIAEIIEEIKVPESLTQIQNFQQKTLIIENLIQKKFESDFDIQEEEFVNKYKGIKLDEGKKIWKYYEQKKYLSNKLEDLLEEEKQQCLESFTNDQSINFDQLSKRLLIHPDVIQQLYNYYSQEINAKKILMKHSNMTLLQIEKNICEQSSQIKQLAIEIFKQNPQSYELIKMLCKQKEDWKFLMDNPIEHFLQNQKDLRKLKKVANEIIEDDPILCIKILESLQAQDQIKNQIFNQPDVLKIPEHFTQILETNCSDSIISIFVKAYLFNLQTNVDKDTLKDFQAQDIFEDYLKKKFSEQEIQILKKQFIVIDQKNESAQQKQIEFQNLIKNQIDLNDQKNYQYIQQIIVQDELIEKYKNNYNKEESKMNENNNQIQKEQVQKDNINLEILSQAVQLPIVLHQEDNINEYMIFGKQFLNSRDQKNVIHLVIHSQNQNFSILCLIKSKYQHAVIDEDNFKINFKQIYEILQPWIQTFLGFRSLFSFIYNSLDGSYDYKNIEILQNLADQYSLFTKNQDEQSFLNTQSVCLYIQNKVIFNEWYDKIKKTQDGKIFAQKFEIQWARSNVLKNIENKEKIKQIFPNFKSILNLQDFNRLRGRKDKDELKRELEIAKEDPDQFSLEVIQQMFGYINRREDMSSLTDHLKELQIGQISIRFLVGFVLQQSNIELRTRLIYYLSQYYSVPLVMISQSSFQSGQSNLIYIPEIAFEMLEGMGIFSFGAGKRCQGKSQLINDLLFPSGSFQHQPFEQNDENVFSSGQIDVFFEKSFEIKRQIVIMDGQGFVNDQAIKNVLALTNIAIINFNIKEINQPESVKDLQNKVDLIKQHDDKIYIILVLRDSLSSDLNVKLQTILEDTSNSELFQKLERLNSQIDQCVKLKNMTNLDKKQRLYNMSPILKIFYSTITKFQELKNQHKFTKQNFLEKFVDEDKLNVNRVKTVKVIIEESENFIKQVDLIKDNIYQQKALPVLFQKSKIRQQILEIRNKAQLQGKEQEILEESMQQQLDEQRQILKQILPNQLIKSFYKIVQNKNGFCSLILYEISKMLRKLTADQLEAPIRLKDELIKKQEDQVKLNNQAQNDEKEARQQEYKNQLDKINNEILQKQISLEYFWRCLVFYMGEETNSQEYNNKIDKSIISKSIDILLKKGDCFELIDGENLEFKGEFIKEVIQSSKKDKVLVVCVIGPQSSGKSTLMNFAFGTQFFTSAGRCTKGIYFTLQKFPSDIENESNVKWLLMLDTEGLQSPDRIDDEYDRKIVLFAMLSANILIINNKGEINAQMINTLKMCCLTFDMLKKYGFSPQIIYTNGQNNDTDLRPFINQVQNLMQEVKDASNSPTIEKTAEEVLGFDHQKINVFGFAYNSHVFDKDKMKGLEQDISYKFGNSNFGVQTSVLFKKICEIVKNKSVEFFEMSKWLEDSKQNWNLIDKYSGDINAFKNLEEFKNDQRVQKQMYQLWNDYLKEVKPTYNDQILCSQKKIQLSEIFQKYGQNRLEQEIQELELNNYEQKQQHIQIHIYDKFDQWMKQPSQKQVTVESVKNYKKDIEAKMDVIKNQFKMDLRSKIKDEQMQIINKIGIKRFLERALQIQKDILFINQQPQEKQSYLRQEFDIQWALQVSEMKNQSQIDEMKQSYFNYLLKIFKSNNKFIKNIGQLDFNQLNHRINPYLQNNQNQNEKLQEFIISELANKQKMVNKMFGFKNEKLIQLVDDARERIFDQNKPENFLKLKELINCNYEYEAIIDVDQQFDRQFLQKNIYSNITIQKIVQKEKFFYDRFNRKTFYYLEEKVDDLVEQINYLDQLFIDLNFAGYKLKQSSEILWIFKKNKVESLNNLDVIQIFKEEFQIEKYYDADQHKQIKNLKKIWVQNFVNDLEFYENDFYEISDNIKPYFKNQNIRIYNRTNPYESIQDHIQLIQNDIIQIENGKDKIVQNLKQMKFPNVKIHYQKSEKARNLAENVFKTLINPKNDDSEMLKKEQNLSLIAQKQLDWIKISQHIIDSVLKVLNIEQNENNINSQQNLNIQKIMESNQMTYQQVENLETEYLNSHLREQIDYELKQKLGLCISVEMDAQILWCAFIVCWILLYQKAEKSFNQQLDLFQKQYQKHFEIFQQIAFGNIGSLTEQNAQSIIQQAFEKFESKQLINYKIKILKDLENIQEIFQTERIYEELDNFYLAFNKDYELKAFIEYVQNPKEIFKIKADELKNIYIETKIIQKYKKEIELQFINNFNSALELFTLLCQQKNSGNQQWDSIANYFQIVNFEENKVLEFPDKQLLTDFISPVIYHVFLKILKGNFDMNELQFSFKDENGNKKVQNFLSLLHLNSQDFKQELIFQFTPQNEKENGALQVFVDQKFQEKIKKIINNNEKNLLIKEIIDVFKSQKDKKDMNKIFQIDIIIESCMKFINLQIDNLQNKQFNEKYFECDQNINDYYKQAIGCQSMCKFCNRKCELGVHNTAEIKHSCENVGHQLRVFAGGYFQNVLTGIKYPSLGTCDSIQTNSQIIIDGEKNTWGDILMNQMSSWKVECKDNLQLKQSHFKFQNFWQQIGPQYCEEKKMQYINKQVEQDQLLQGKMIAEGVVVIVMDESTSMIGQKWMNAVKGAKQYIEFLFNSHANPDSVNLVIIFFSRNDLTHIVYDGALDYPIENIWNRNGRGTEYDKPIQLAFDQIDKYIQNKQMAKLYFFTDGQGHYPTEAIKSIAQSIKLNKNNYLHLQNSKLQILLMSENEKNSTMDRMKSVFNQISNRYLDGYNICQLETNVQTNEIGKIMIESFKFQ